MNASIERTTRVRREARAVWKAMGGEVAVIDPSATSVFSLNEVGARCWELADGRTVDELVDILLNEFDVERTQLESDVTGFLTQLVDRGLLVAESVSATMDSSREG